MKSTKENKAASFLFAAAAVVSALLLSVFMLPAFASAEVECKEISVEDEAKLTSEMIGIGGGGALFDPAISPFDSNEMVLRPDMGGLYISHDKGNSWFRPNLHGTVMSVRYDPTTPGRMYAGGSGLWRSDDYGDTFELLFPQPDDLIARMIHNENSLQILFSKSKVYDPYLYIKDILVDPNDSKHIFVLGYASKVGQVYESTDDGLTFTRLFRYERETQRHAHFEFNELIFKEETDEIFVINDEGVIGYDRDKGEPKVVSTRKFSDVATVKDDDGKTCFIVIEITDTRTDSTTMVYWTHDFADPTDIHDITDALTAVKPLEFDDSKYGHVTYIYNFRYMSATSLDNIFVTSWTNASTTTNIPGGRVGNYPYPIDGVIRYDGTSASYLFGNPFRNQLEMAARSWNDGNTYALGVSASKQKPGEFIFTTLVGVNYSEDGVDIYPKQTAVVEGEFPNAKYVTNGIDEQTTYGVCIDPTDANNILLMNTDLGGIRSTDGGKSWVLNQKGLKTDWQWNEYDAFFDKRKPDVVYSLWSKRHNAPLEAGNQRDGVVGGFAISNNRGESWDSSYSTGLPDWCIPIDMEAVYPKDSEEVTIYVATFNCGFYVSYDSGRTFNALNDGIEPVSYKEGEEYQFILAADIEIGDGHIYGMTANNTYTGQNQNAEIFELIDGKWKKLDLPNEVTRPRDLCIHDGDLYISCAATTLWNKKDGCDFQLKNGGLLRYSNGEFAQLYDESAYITSVVFDSHDTMFVSDIEGNIYRKTATDSGYTRIYKDYHYTSKGLQLSDNEDELYLSTMGGGVLKLSGLRNLYSPEELEDAGNQPGEGDEFLEEDDGKPDDSDTGSGNGGGNSQAPGAGNASDGTDSQTPGAEGPSGGNANDDWWSRWLWTGGIGNSGGSASGGVSGASGSTGSSGGSGSQGQGGTQDVSGGVPQGSGTNGVAVGTDGATVFNQPDAVIYYYGGTAEGGDDSSIKLAKTGDESLPTAPFAVMIVLGLCAALISLRRLIIDD